MALPGYIAQSMLYGRVTIGKSSNLAVTDSDDYRELVSQGLYRIMNIGANPAYVEVTNSASELATTSQSMLMSTISTAPELAVAHVEIGMADVKVGKSGNRFIHAICGSGLNTTLRITKLTRV